MDGRRGGRRGGRTRGGAGRVGGRIGGRHGGDDALVDDAQSTQEGDVVTASNSSHPGYAAQLFHQPDVNPQILNPDLGMPEMQQPLSPHLPHNPQPPPPPSYNPPPPSPFYPPSPQNPIPPPQQPHPHHPFHAGGDAGHPPPPPQGLVINPGDFQRLLDNVYNVQHQNDHLQARVEFLTQERGGRSIHMKEAEKMGRFQPFIPKIAMVDVPERLMNISLDPYNGRTDPREHLKCFIAKMALNRATDAYKCLAFPASLKGAAMTWFTRLAPHSITCFNELSSRFLAHFSVQRAETVSTMSLFNYRQEPNESIKAYLARFGNMLIAIEDEEPTMCVAAFKHGLRAGVFNSRLATLMPKNMAELRERDDEYIIEEEDDRQKRRRDAKELGV